MARGWSGVPGGTQVTMEPPDPGLLIIRATAEEQVGVWMPASSGALHRAGRELGSPGRQRHRGRWGRAARQAPRS